jgi:hypothetical protein
VSPKRGDSVAPPPDDHQYDVRYAYTNVIEGWDELGNKAPGNTIKAWETMRNSPAPAAQTDRHHQLKHKLATVCVKGKELPQWQIEVLGGGRIWYGLDETKKIVWITQASVGHPKLTE